MTRKLVVCSMAVVAAVTLAGVSFAAGFSTLTAYINPELKITVNGSNFVPKDANGNALNPVVINGSTYLPVKALGQALGAHVNYDSGTKTVVVNSGGVINPSEPVMDSDKNNNSVNGSWSVLRPSYMNYGFQYTTAKDLLQINGAQYSSGLISASGAMESEAQYTLDGKYKRMVGTLELKSNPEKPDRTVTYIVTNQVTGDVVCRGQIKGGEKCNIDGDVTGISKLKVYVQNPSYVDYYYSVVLGDVKFQ